MIKLNVAVIAMSGLLFSTFSADASLLQVHKNEMLTISNDKDANILVDEWVMEDGSKIIVKIPKWKINATKATFGRNVIIDARGADGTSYSNDTQPAQPGAAPNSNGRGATGSNGKPGVNGGNGAEIEIVVGLEKVDDLIINSSGGEGGNGGKGGKGQKGGGAHCYAPSVRGGTGGNGGEGGSGANGGDGGNVSFRYWVLNLAAIPGNSALPGLRIISQGGEEGIGGAGGPGGNGGDGVPKCDIFGGRGSGPDGPSGHNGHSGSAGRGGIVSIQPVSSPVP